MSISARNQLKAQVKSIKTGATNDVVELELAGGESLVAVITAESTASLGLVEGKETLAIFKAPSVILALDEGYVFSSRNQFKAKVVAITHGSVNAEVVVKTEAGTELVAIVTESSLKNMGLQLGSEVLALVKASHVILAVKA